jgi:AcrR family transcriptional regulator
LNSVKIKSARGAPRRRAYHHGALRQQLLEVTEKIILEQGVEGFTLREAARRAGVSPAAPAHHFKDARGLLTAVALLGFREFGAALEKADAAGASDPSRRLREQALAYVRFALERPARFQLMFRPEKLDTEDEEFKRVARHSYEVLENAIRAATGVPAAQPVAGSAYGLLLAVWSLVHGFSHLALGGELRDPKGNTAGPRCILETLLPLMLEHLPVPERES